MSPERSDIKRSSLGTWYPPGEAQTIQALRLAAKHKSPEKALRSIERTISQWEKRAVEIDARTLYGWHRTRDILRFWLASENSGINP